MGEPEVGQFAYPAERNAQFMYPIVDLIVKRTDLEELKDLKIANNLKRDGRRTGEPGQGIDKAITQNKLLKTLLGRPIKDDTDKSGKS